MLLTNPYTRIDMRSSGRNDCNRVYNLIFVMIDEFRRIDSGPGQALSL